jgi:hypothetical protein
MYTVTNAIGVRNGLSKRWEQIDLGTFTVAQLYSTFRRVQLTLSVNSGPTPYYLDLASIAATYQMYTGTVAALLTENGNATLPTTTTGVVMQSAKAEYADAFRAGYAAIPVTTHNVVVETPTALSAPNLRLFNTVKDVDYTLFYKACLVSVCGYFHRIDTDGVNGAMVVDGMRTCTHSGENQIGLLSFSEVCELQQTPITAAMIDTSVPGKATVTLPVDTTNKTVVLMLAGYMLQVDDTALSQVSGSGYTIDFTKLNIVDRYHEADAYLDLTALDLSSAAANQDQISIEELTTPETIVKWLTLSQSFFVVMNHPDIYFESVPVRQTGLPGRYIAYSDGTHTSVLVT